MTSALLIALMIVDPLGAPAPADPLAPSPVRAPAAGESTAPVGPRRPIVVREIFWGDRGGHLHHRPMAFRGETPLEGADLYQALGRNDLATELEQRKTEAGALLVLGGVGLAGGAIAAKAASQSEQACLPGPGGSCYPQDNSTMMAVGIMAALGGLLLAVAGASLDPDPLSDAEREKLIATYNRSLQAPAAADPERPIEHTPPARPVAVPSAAVLGDGAVLGFSGRF